MFPPIIVMQASAHEDTNVAAATAPTSMFGVLYSIMTDVI